MTKAVSGSIVACRMHTDEHIIERAATDLYALGKLSRDAWKVQVPELAPASIAILAALVAHGPVRVSELAHGQHIDESVASRQLSGLSSRGLAVRKRDVADARALQADATDRGRQVLQEAHQRIVAILAEALDAWDPAEVASLAVGLHRLRSDLSMALERSRTTLAT